MLNEKVNSSFRPDPVMKLHRECRMAKNITEIVDGESVSFEYDEVFFITDATVEEIEANFETYWQIGVDYGKPEPEPATWEEMIEAQVVYTALMTDTLLEEEE